VKLKLRRQDTQNKQLGRVMDICSVRSWSVDRRGLNRDIFPPKKEIHDELGSAHAMNFGRNPKYLEVRSDSDATSDTGHSLLQLITARIGLES